MRIVPSMIAGAAMTGVMVISSISCDKKPSEAVVQAQAEAKAAADRVADLEKQVADIKAGKQAAAADKDTVEHMSQSQLKALNRQLTDARKRADDKRKEAVAVAAAPAPAASAPKAVVLDVPAETQLSVKLNRELATDKDQPGDAWEGTLAEDVVVGGKVAWPAGTPVRGVVAQSTAAGRLSSGQGGMGIKLTAVGQNEVEAGTYMVVGDPRGKRNAKYIGGTAALGALIGILSDKNHQGDHALGGAAAGAAAGTALAAGTADTVIRIPAAKPVVFSLTAPEKVTLR